MRVGLIEDDALIAEHMKVILENNGHKIIGIAPSTAKAEALLKREPDVFLVDINLGKMVDNGFLTASMLKEKGIPFLFVTANNDSETLNKAISYHPEGYITKPFKEMDIVAALQLVELKYYNKKITIHTNSGDYNIPSINILYVKAENVYVDVYMVDGHKYTERSTLKEFEAKLGDNFVRSHRSFVVNRKRVTALKGDKIYLGDVTLPVSKTFEMGDCK